MRNVKTVINELLELDTSLYGQDFLLTWDKTEDELKAVLRIAEALRTLYQQNISACCFDSGLAISIFRDQSTRTRFSFASAANLLGLAVQDLDETKSQIAHGETVRETAHMISFLTEVIGIRDDMFLGAGHTYMLEVAAALDDGFQQGILPQRPAIVNLQCDVDHPTQAMADLMWLEEHFGGLEHLRGKKIAMTWAYSPSYGKPLSVPQGIIGVMTRMGMQVHLAHPEHYDLIPDVLEVARKNAAQSGGAFVQHHSMDDAFEDADIVYPKSWAPYHVMGTRTAYLQSGDTAGLKELERACLGENARHADWTCDERKMKRTRDGAALYLHCLPADITGVSCERGEVEASVFEQHRLHTYKEAAAKPFIIAAMILAARSETPAATLQALLAKANPRNRA